MKLVAYYPKGILAPVELLAVMVPVGMVTRKIWIEALSDRICDMVEQDKNPYEAAREACEVLDCPICDEPDQLGQYIVKDNLNLQAWINNSIISDEDPFSGYAADDNLSALEAIQNTDLETWVSHAQYLISGGGLERYVRERTDDDLVGDEFPKLNIQKEVFCPPGVDLQRSIKAVKIPFGVITFEDWLKGLSEKVQEMLFLEKDPRRAAIRVCKKLGIPPCEEIERFGNHVVKNDSKFRTYIYSLQDSFPIVFSDKNIDPYDKAFYKVRIDKWADMVCNIGRNQLYELWEEPDIFPSKDIKPYVDFIEDNLLFWSEFVEDENSCSLYSYFYDFKIQLDIRDDIVKLWTILGNGLEVSFKDIQDFELKVKRFNELHIPLLTHYHEIRKNWFFSKPIYKVHYFVLEHKWSVSSNTNDVANFISMFYQGLLDLYESKDFIFSLPEANQNEKDGKNFIEHLRLLLVFFINYYSKREKELQEEIRLLDLGH